MNDFTEDRRGGSGIVVWIVLLLLAALFVFGYVAHGQTSMGPIKTPQINMNLYVGQSGYATIQSAVTYACKTGNKSFAVVIGVGMTPSDTIASVTGGCATTYITDLRNPGAVGAYAWSGTAYAYVSQACTPAANTCMVYPAVGVGVSTGTGWGPSIPANDLARLGAAGGNTFNPVAIQSMGQLTLTNSLSMANAVNGITYGDFVVNALTGLGPRHWGVATSASNPNQAFYIAANTPANAIFADSQGAHLMAGSDVGGSAFCTVASPCNQPLPPFPPAGVPVSNGTTYDASIPPADIPRLGASQNNYTGIQHAAALAAYQTISSPDPGDTVHDVSNQHSRIVGRNSLDNPMGFTAQGYAATGAATTWIDCNAQGVAAHCDIPVPATVQGSVICTVAAPCGGGGAPISCQVGVGAGGNANAPIPAGTSLITSCRNETGKTWTITAIRCIADTGASTCNATNNVGQELLTAAILGSPGYSTGTQSGVTTIAPGASLMLTFITDGTTKQIGIDVAGTYQ